MVVGTKGVVMHQSAISHLNGGMTRSCCLYFSSRILRKCQTMMRKNLLLLQDKLINQPKLR